MVIITVVAFDWLMVCYWPPDTDDDTLPTCRSLDSQNYTLSAKLYTADITSSSSCPTLFAIHVLQWLSRYALGNHLVFKIIHLSAVESDMIV